MIVQKKRSQHESDSRCVLLWSVPELVRGWSHCVVSANLNVQLMSGFVLTCRFALCRYWGVSPQHCADIEESYHSKSNRRAGWVNTRFSVHVTWSSLFPCAELWISELWHPVTRSWRLLLKRKQVGSQHLAARNFHEKPVLVINLLQLTLWKYRVKGSQLVVSCWKILCADLSARETFRRYSPSYQGVWDQLCNFSNYFFLFHCSNAWLVQWEALC